MGGVAVIAGDIEMGGAGDIGVFLRRSAMRDNCSKMFDSVVCARPVPEFCAGAGAGGAAGAVGAGGAGVDCARGGAVVGGGADGARGAVTGGEGAIGLVELGRFVQASSSNPLSAGGGGLTTELDLAGGCTGGEEVDIRPGLVAWGELVRRILSDAVEIALRSTLAGGRLLLG